MIPEIWSVRQNFFSLWTIFCPFTPLPLTTQRIKILKYLKNPRDIIILHKCTIQMIIICMVLQDINCNKQGFFVLSWAIFALLTS